MKTTLRFATLFLLLLSGGAAFAQTPPASEPAAVRAYRNVVRLDVLAVFTRNRSRLVYGETALPLLLRL
ncbi:hypothetical protein D0N36_04065 [Hymenobacter lapidiphilus]|uniref:hypothetical protein n=1 Tax=Hymenobacter sp. CCM 8763 TaxID=2303334 RepID=UPI000E3461BC|nr:hypothetical protein [Hymenobacter sp. CCM 8763]RFP66204.1 hypothetical protein D0N36_04065 [Hymenobacter sp. CCM 8763]